VFIYRHDDRSVRHGFQRLLENKLCQSKDEKYELDLNSVGFISFIIKTRQARTDPDKDPGSGKEVEAIS